MPTADTDNAALLQQIQTSLDATGVWVDPSLRSLFTPNDLARIEANIARSDQPQFVVVYPFTDGDPFNNEPEELLTVLHDASQVDGLYLSARSPENGDPTADYASVGLVGRLWGPGPDATYVTSPAEDHHPGDISGALVEATSTVADGTAQQAWDAYIDALPRTSSGTSSSDSSSASDAEDSGGGNAVGVGAVVGVVVALAAVAAVWRVRRARRRTFSLPASVIAHVREAHDDRLEEQARAEVLALGEAIDAEDVDPSDEPVAWQAALDHYDGAKRVLSRVAASPRCSTWWGPSCWPVAEPGPSRTRTPGASSSPPRSATSTRSTPPRAARARSRPAGDASRCRCAPRARRTSRADGRPTSSTSSAAAGPCTTSTPTPSPGPPPATAP